MFPVPPCRAWGCHWYHLITASGDSIVNLKSKERVPTIKHAAALQSFPTPTHGINPSCLQGWRLSRQRVPYIEGVVVLVEATRATARTSKYRHVACVYIVHLPTLQNGHTSPTPKAAAAYMQPMRSLWADCEQPMTSP